jgi:hypothetical protein
MHELSGGSSGGPPATVSYLLPEHWGNPISAWLRWLKSDGRPDESVAVRRTQITRLARERAERDPWSLTTQDLAEWLADHPAWAPWYAIFSVTRRSPRPRSTSSLQRGQYCERALGRDSTQREGTSHENPTASQG